MSEAGIEPASESGSSGTTTPGARLSAARLAQGLKPADVARQLKLSVWQVEALEAGRYEQLPGAIFVRGFIRNYARLVKLDPDELLQSASGSLPRGNSRPEAPPSRDIPFPAAPKSRWSGIAAIGFVIVALLAVYEFHWKGGEPVVVAVTPPAPKPPAAPARAATPAKPADGGSAGPSGEKRAVPEKAVPSVAPAVPPKGPPAAAKAAVNAGERPAAKPGERVVRLVFADESWVEIRDRNGAIVLAQLNRPGTTQEVSGAPPLAIVVGNAHGVTLTYDDRPVDLAPHTRVDVARMTLQ